MQREEQRTESTSGGTLDAPRDRSEKPRPVLTKDLNILQADVRMPELEIRPDFVSRYAPTQDVLHRHGPEDAERLDALKQGGGSTVVGRPGGERLMRAGHIVTVTL